MDFPATIVVLTVVLVEIQGMTIYFGYQGQNYSSHPPAQPEQQQYTEYREILYLTPSQVKALQEEEDQLNRPEDFYPESVTHHHHIAYPQTVEKQELIYLQPHPNGNPHAQFMYPQPNTTPTIPHSSIDPFHIIPPPNFRQPKTIAHNTFQTQKPKRILKPIPFFPDSDTQIYNDNSDEPNIPYKNNVPNNNKPKAKIIIKERPTQKPVKDTDDAEQIIRQQLKEQWLQVLKQNIAHFKALGVLFQNQIVSNVNNTKFHYLAQEDDRYNEKNSAAEIYNLVRSRNQHQLNKQRTVLQSEAVANAPPLPYEDINIKQFPAPFVAQAAGPQSAEFSVPEPFEEKDPQAYEFPLEYYKGVPYPNVKQTNEVDRPVPNEDDVQIPFPVTMYYGDRPFMPVRVIPVKNPSHRESWPQYMREEHH